MSGEKGCGLSGTTDKWPRKRMPGCKQRPFSRWPIVSRGRANGRHSGLSGTKPRALVCSPPRRTISSETIVAQVQPPLTGRHCGQRLPSHSIAKFQASANCVLRQGHQHAGKRVPKRKGTLPYICPPQIASSDARCISFQHRCRHGNGLPASHYRLLSGPVMPVKLPTNGPD